VQGKLDRTARLLRRGPVRYHVGMTKARSDRKKGSGSGGETPANPGADRQERLSAALRANLARRKGQARARKDASAAVDERQGAASGYGDKAAGADAAEPAAATHDSAGFIPDKPSS
jgi:hypothetical protein